MTSKLDFRPAKAVLDASNLDADYVALLETHFVHRGEDDRREAAKMAVDASKSLGQIAIAVLVALGGFLQYALSSGLERDAPPVVLLYLAGGLTFVSMCLGFVALGRTYRRGEGRDAPKEPAWSTLPVRKLLGFQAILGVLGLALFVASTVSWKTGQPADSSLLLSFPGEGANQLKTSGKLVLEGTWSALELRPQGTLAISLGPVPERETSRISIEAQ